MDRINGAGHVDHRFVAEDVATNRPPTEITEIWLNGVQEELCAFIESQGFALDPNDNTLLGKAIRKAIQTGQRSVIINNATFAPAVAGTGKAVYWDAANNRFDLALADGSAKQNMVGFADVANGNVYAFGDAVLFVGLMPGRYYLDAVTAGAITAVAPPNQVFVGIAKSATDIFVDIDPAGLTQTAADARYLQISNARIRLTGNITFYVATTGNDITGTGAVGAPWATVQKAIDIVQSNYDLSGYFVTIQLADGTYSSAVTVNGPFVGAISEGSVTIKGNAGAPANVVLAQVGNGLSAGYGAKITITDLKILVTSGHGLLANNATIAFGNIVFGAVGAGVYYHIVAFQNAHVYALSNYSIVGGALGHLSGDSDSLVIITSKTITITGTPLINTYAVLQNGACFIAYGCVFSGSTTGTRYSAVANAVIQVNGGGANYFPGTAAGSTATGGQYV